MRSGIASLLLIFGLLSGCDWGDYITAPDPSGPGCSIRVQVVFQFCSYTFVRILDSRYQELGDVKWEHTYKGKTYENVFIVKNPCALGHGEFVGKEFEIEIIDEFEDPCAYCLAGYSGRLPKAEHAIRLCTDEKYPQ